jgi:hypothetical protein
MLMQTNTVTIKFAGKNTRYQVKKYCLDNAVAKDSKNDEEATEKKEVIDKKAADLNHATQLQQLNTYFLDGAANTCNLERSLLSKIAGYKGQDLKNKKIVLTDIPLITLAELTEKLVASRLRCCYCSAAVKLFYSQNRDAMQWTLDRLDNNLAHTNNNTVIACLGCNLQRRNRAADKFMFTKKLTITKM